jgi:hypothetical protein
MSLIFLAFFLSLALVAVELWRKERGMDKRVVWDESRKIDGSECFCVSHFFLSRTLKAPLAMITFAFATVQLSTWFEPLIYFLHKKVVGCFTAWVSLCHSLPESDGRYERDSIIHQSSIISPLLFKCIRTQLHIILLFFPDSINRHILSWSNRRT